MREDEYNIVKVNNEGRRSLGGEFGRTQSNEFTSFGENKTTTNKNGLNAEPTKNDSVIENTGLGEAPTYDNKQQQDLINEASDASSTVSTATTSTTVASTSATTSAATVSSTVATAASVIAVTTVSVTAGLTIVTNNNASAELTKFTVTSNMMEYSLVLRDTDDDPFILSVENSNYQSVRQLQEGTNDGSFSGLVPNETYNIYVKEDIIGGKTILSEVFTTYEVAEPESNFYSFDVYQDANFKANTIEVVMNFDDEAENYSDFEFYLESVEHPDTNYTYTLERSTAVQQLSTKIPDVVEFDLFKDTFNYSFKYKNKGEVVDAITAENFKFNDSSEAVEEFRSIEFIDNKANYLTYSFDVRLDYQDDLNRYSDVMLTMTDVEDESRTQTFTLEKTTEVQTLTSAKMETPSPRINADGDSEPTGSDEPDVTYILDVRHSTFEYTLTCKDKAETITLANDRIRFNDSSSAQSVFRELVWDKTANFLSRSFEAKLDYQDDFKYYSDFTLTIGTADRYEEFVFEPNNQVQSFFFHQDEYGYMVDPRSGDEYPYVLTCFSKEINDTITLAEGSITFTDNSGAVSEITTFNWDEKVNFNDLSFSVQLDLQDDLDYIDNIKLVVTETDDNNPGDQKVFGLDEVTTDQELNFNYNDAGEMVETSLDIQTGTFEYSLVYDYKGVETEFVHKENVQFYNSIESTFNTFECDYNIYNDGLMYFKFDLDNVAGDYEEATIVFTPADSSGAPTGDSGPASADPITVNATVDSQWQSVNMSGFYINSDAYYSVEVQMRIYDPKNPKNIVYLKNN